MLLCLLFSLIAQAEDIEIKTRKILLLRELPRVWIIEPPMIFSIVSKSDVPVSRFSINFCRFSKTKIALILSLFCVKISVTSADVVLMNVDWFS